MIISDDLSPFSSSSSSLSSSSLDVNKGVWTPSPLHQLKGVLEKSRHQEQVYFQKQVEVGWGTWLVSNLQGQLVLWVKTIVRCWKKKKTFLQILCELWHKIFFMSKPLRVSWACFEILIKKETSSERVVSCPTRSKDLSWWWWPPIGVCKYVGLCSDLKPSIKSIFFAQSIFYICW